MRHDVAGEAADVGDRAAEIDDDIFGAAVAQRLQFAGDLIGRTEDRGVVAELAHLGVVVDKALAVVAGLFGELVDPHMALQPPDLCRFQFVRRVGEMHRAGDTDLHRVIPAAASRDIAFELRDVADDVLHQIVLAEQQIVAALGDLAHRALRPGAHPERRVRPRRRRRLDDDVVELPELALVAELLVAGESLGDDRHRLVEAFVGLLHRHRKPGELVVAIALADAEIEPPAGQQVESRRLLGQQHRVVPRQHQDGGAEPQGRGARTEPGQQVEAGGDLAEPGEMMLDDKGRVIAERLGLDIVLDPLAEALAAVGELRAGLRPLSLGAAEQSKPHVPCSCCLRRR